MKRTQILSKEPGLSDLLQFAHLIEDGVILNKDGAFLVSYAVCGPDLQAAGSAELDGLTATVNRMTTQLEDGWMLHFDEVRVPSLDYPETGAFPEPVSKLIDAERRAQYQAEGAHYENRQYLTLVWKFPLQVIKTTRHWFVEGLNAAEGQKNLTTLLAEFNERVLRMVGILSSYLKLTRLTSAELLSYLNSCLTGDLQPIKPPPPELFLDVILGRKAVVGGYYPKIGSKWLRVLSVIGYLNDETMPGLLDAMGTYPMLYRFSNRFIALSEATAQKELKRYQKNWNNKVKGFFGIVSEVVLGRPAQKLNQDALLMSEQITDAMTANSNHSTRFGYWTASIVLLHEDQALLERAITDLSRYIEQSGFALLVEDINALDAWLGSIPGHGSANMRRVFMTGFNLAHVLPLHTIWAGPLTAAKSSLLPLNAPPVFYAATTGKTPFRFHCDVGDVGHQVVLGPTGAGKSTYLGLLTAQFLRYPNAQIFIFDKDLSHQALTIALSGHHYDIGHQETLAFCPLADLSSDAKKIRAGRWIEDLVTLQQVQMTPVIREAIFSAINAMSLEAYAKSRNLTVLHSMIQNDAVRGALQYYTVEGPIKLLDATHDSLQDGWLQTFEMNWLLAQKADIYLPILRYLFDQIESRLENSNHPSLIILEEAWAYIGHEVFARQLKDWLKTLRKKNARVVFATQSLADLYDPATQSLTATTAAILESCPTKVYLPNQNMESEIQTLYLKMGLSQRELEIIGRIALPKRHYFVTTPEGRRLIDLGLTEKSQALAFIGLSREKSQELLACKKIAGAGWLTAWLAKNQSTLPLTSEQTV